MAKRRKTSTADDLLEPVGSVAYCPALPVQSLVCPLSTKSTVRHTAKRGVNTGNEFWGCTGYPSCRGTRPIN